jgi:hypothetical protein
LLHAGAPSIAPANTTVRQIVWVASRFIGPEAYHEAGGYRAECQIETLPDVVERAKYM